MFYPDVVLELHHATARERQEAAAKQRLITSLLRARRLERWARRSAGKGEHLDGRARRLQLRVA